MKTPTIRAFLSLLALLVIAAVELAEAQPAGTVPAFQRALSQQVPPSNVLMPPPPGTPAGQQVQPVIPQPVQPPAPVSQPQAAPQPQQPAQPAQLQPPAAPVQIQPPQPFQFPAGRQPGAKRGEVSFNFDDADVFSVIQTIFGDVLKVNYIVDPNVKGRVTFRSVAPVAKEDVLPLMEVILRLNGIGIVEEGGLYRIVPIGDLAKEPAPVGVGRNAEKVQITGKALLQVVPVKYVQSSEIVRVLTPFLSKNALIIDVPKSNYIIISDTDTNVKRLLQLVEIFDSEQIKKIKPEVFVYAVQNGKAKDISAMLQQIFLGKAAPAARTTTPAKTTTTTPGQQPAPVQQPQVSMGPETGEALVSDITRIFPDEITNSIIILATPDDYDLIAETIAKIDVQPRQVVIEGLLARVDLTDNFSLGVAWSLKTNVGIKDLSPLTNKETPLTGTIGVMPSGTSLANTLDPGFTFVATDPSGTVRARITAAVKDSKAKILAAPHILVSDNREARIQVGSQVPLATSTTTTPLGGVQVTNTTTSTIQYKDIGIILKVKPQVNDSGLVALEIAQEISSLGDNVIVGGTTEISINKTEATTNLVARDGETIVIGGLIQENVTKSIDGIPILSKIPLIGSLFSNTSDTTTRTELILLLTPRVVRTQLEAGKTTADYVEKFKRGTKDKQIDDFLQERKREGKNGGATEK